MTREGRDAEITDQVTYLDMVCDQALAGVDRSSVRFVAFGFSQGTAAVCRWAAASEIPPAEIILWGGAVPSDVLEPEPRAQLMRSSFTIVFGNQDAIAREDLIAEHRKQLDAAGLSYRFLMFDGGHEIEGRTLSEIAADISARH